MITAIILSAFIAAAASVYAASSSSKAVNNTTASTSEDNAAALEQEQAQFETSNYLNSTGFQVAQNKAAGINSDFQDVSSSGASSNAVDYSGLASAMGAQNMQAAQTKAQLQMECAQSISSAVGNALVNGAQYEQNKTLRNQAKQSSLEYAAALRKTADDYVVENTDVRGFDNYDLFGSWVDVTDDAGNVVGGKYENFDELSLETFYNSDEYARYLQNGGAERYTPEEFEGLGYSSDDAIRLSKIARSSLGRSDVRRRIYEKATALNNSRIDYDCSKANPFSRSEYSDVPSVVTDYQKAVFETTMSQLSADFESNKNRQLFFGGRNGLKIQDLENEVTRQDAIKSIQYLSTLNADDFGSMLASNDVQEADLARQLNALNTLCLNAQLDVAKTAMASTSPWARQFGFYQLSCLQNGQFAPMEVAKDLGSVFGDVAGGLSSLTSLGSFLNSAKFLGKDFSKSQNFGNYY